MKRSQAGWSALSVARFYEEEPRAWEAVLGSTRHYHFGIVDPSAAFDDAEAHFNHAVRMLYRWVPMGARVLDVGCGWGGAGRMLSLERKAVLHGVTVSPAQARSYVSDVPGAVCTCADIASLELEGSFDVAILMESLCHVDQPHQALATLRGATRRLILLDHVARGPSFVNQQWQMRFPSHEEFRRLVTDAGFSTIEHDQATEVPWLPAARYWLRNLETTFPGGPPPGQFTLLAGLCRWLIANGGSPTQIRLLVAS